ncbi:helix-turn-helix domain-containing protein [Ruminococcus sp.]
MENIIGKRITAALAIKNVMQKQLAERLGVKPNIVSYWCSGQRTPNAAQIAEIAKVLGVSADYLLGVSIAPTTDKELRYICDYTGLSDRVVRLLHASRGSCIV